MDALGLRDASPLAPSTTFVGRAAELALLDGLLGDASVRLVTITGPAGVGKSRLAAEHLLTRSGASGAAGVHAVELSAVYEAAVVDDAIVAALPDGAPFASAASRLWELYAGGPVLLLLDNLEQIDGVGEVLLRLLADYPQLQVLATSITPARVVGEHLLRLAPFPEGADPGSDPSVALFESRARAADATFTLDEASVPTVLELCRLLGGLPLAIEIAAARVASVPPGLMLRQLATSSADQVVRQGRTAGVPDRHLSVGAALDWTVRLLPTTSIDVLTQVSVFEAPFSLAAAVGVIHPTTDVPDLLDRLSDLVDVQLLALDVAEPDEPRFSLSAVVRAYAQRRLRESGGETKVRQAHAAYWSERCRQDSATARTHWPDVEAALDFAVLNGWSDEALRLAVSAASGLSTSPGAESMLLPRMERLLAAEHRRDDPLEAAALLWSTLHTPADGDDPVAYGARTAQRLARSVEVARASGDDGVLLRALEVVVRSLVVTFDLPAALAAMQEGLALATRTGDQAALARFEVWAAMAASLSGDLERASALARSAYDRGQGAGDDTAVIYSATLLMRMPAANRGTVDLPSLEMLLERAGGLGQAIVTLQVLEALSERDLAAGDVESALRWIDRQLVVAAACDGTIPLGSVPPVLALVQALMALGDVENAVRLRESVVRLEPSLPRILPGSGPRYLEAVADLHERLSSERYAELAAEVAGSSVRQANRLALAIMRSDGTPRLHLGERSTDAPGRGAVLSRREREVLVELTRGGTNREIGASLGLTSKTVMHYTMSIYRKLGVRGRAEATAWAVRNGMVPTGTAD